MYGRTTWSVYQNIETDGQTDTVVYYNDILCNKNHDVNMVVLFLDILFPNYHNRDAVFRHPAPVLI